MKKPTKTEVKEALWESVLHWANNYKKVLDRCLENCDITSDRCALCALTWGDCSICPITSWLSCGCIEPWRQVSHGLDYIGQPKKATEHMALTLLFIYYVEGGK